MLRRPVPDDYNPKHYDNNMRLSAAAYVRDMQRYDDMRRLGSAWVVILVALAVLLALSFALVKLAARYYEIHGITTVEVVRHGGEEREG